jgi:hypothetical protein
LDPKTLIPAQCRLDDDERLDTLLDHLEQRIPGAASLAQQPNRPAGAGGQLARDARPADDDTASEQSVKSIMQGELRAVKDRCGAWGGGAGVMGLALGTSCAAWPAVEAAWSARSAGMQGQPDAAAAGVQRTSLMQQHDRVHGVANVAGFLPSAGWSSWSRRQRSSARR